jgi:large subunit ribosomal protein L15
MTDKKRRQRGSRTHGGGTHKNRRGAGSRGGRGAAGRDKHEFHRHDPLGKHGFDRPEAVTDTVAEVRVRELDEEIRALVEAGVAETEDDGYRIDARDAAEDGHEADAVKLLGGGQVYNELHVVADAFTAGAVELVEEAGGSVSLTERAEPDGADGAAETDADETDHEHE